MQAAVLAYAAVNALCGQSGSINPTISGAVSTLSQARACPCVGALCICTPAQLQLLRACCMWFNATGSRRRLHNASAPQAQQPTLFFGAVAPGQRAPIPNG